jgi:uncharacterized ferredoxin-like protein
MPLYSEENIRREAIHDVARKMMIAARTAPKGRGIDNIEITCIEGDTISAVAEKMKAKVNEEGWAPMFIRDADNILKAASVILIGTRISSIGLNCGMCGYATCNEKDSHPDHPCVFNTGDLGIAIGSAVSVAMDHRVDNRIMYSVGMVVREMGLLSEEVRIIYGIPLSVSSKNPFFDRK